MLSNQLTMGYINSAMNKVYNYMFAGILSTAFVAYIISSIPTLQMTLLSSPLKWAIMLGPLACLLIMTFAFDKLSTPVLAGLYALVTVIFGASLSTIFIVYSLGTIGLALFSASSVFLVMSLYGYFTKKDLSSWRQFLFIGLIGLIISQIANLFMQSSAFDMALSAIAVILFTLLTAYDTQKIKETMYNASSKDTGRLAIMGALTLYLDFLNLFIHLLNLMGGRK